MLLTVAGSENEEVRLKPLNPTSPTPKTTREGVVLSVSAAAEMSGLAFDR